jgi:transposase-like protein
MLDGLENVIVSLYAKGMSNSDIEEQIKCIISMFPGTISRITDRVSSDSIAWQNRPLARLSNRLDGVLF